MVAYPDSLPTECVGELIRIVRGGTIVPERAAFAANAWNVQGYLQGVILGDPDPLPQAVPQLRDLYEALTLPQAIPEAIPPWVFTLIAAIVELLKRFI